MNGPVRVSSAWLALREPADAAARAVDLVEEVRSRLPTGGTSVIHDLGCGTGSMGRWLAPRLTGTQHWIMQDRDDDLLAHAAAAMPERTPGGATVTVTTRQHDITHLGPNDLADAALITCSALLDMLTAPELDRLVAACVQVRCPVLFTLSVTGRVSLHPADPLDERFGAAFNAHQRRLDGDRRLLGPDAAGHAARAFARHGAEVLVRPSPWRLGADQSDLLARWLTGWLGAACEQQPELTDAAHGYAQRRLAQAAVGRLTVTVHHDDLLARAPR